MCLQILYIILYFNFGIFYFVVFRKINFVILCQFRTDICLTYGTRVHFCDKKREHCLIFKKNYEALQLIELY